MEEWEYVMVGGRPFKQHPWCDCTKVAHGFTKRDDGRWVRPCCMRPQRQAWEKRRAREEQALVTKGEG